MTTTLPEGWTETELGNFIDSMANGIYKPEKFYAEDGIPCLRMYNIQDGQIVLENVKRMRLTSTEIAQYRLLPGDLLVNRVNSRELVGKTAICADFSEPTVFESKNIRLRLRHDTVDPWYVNYSLMAAGNREKLSDEAKQTVGMATVSQPHLRRLTLPFPPLAEQKRIVAKVEGLLARVNAARQRLAKVPAILKRFRQAVLAAACSGQLTEDWRERNAKVQPAVIRREKLLEERKAIWERTYRGRGKYPEPFSPPSSYAGLPDSWCWVTVSHLSFQDVGFAFKSAEFAKNGVKLLRGENIEPGSLRWADTRYWPHHRAAEFGHLLVQAGEIILAMDRPVISTGLKIARVKVSDLPCLLVQRVMRFRMVEEGSADYLYLRLQHRDFIDFLTHDGMTGSDLPHITGTGVAEFPVPLPPVEEEREIVHRVEALFKLADAIEKRVAAATQRADRLMQSILAKAFRGELVPTEAELARAEGRDYEPASALLERIQIERAGHPAPPKRRVRRRER